MKRSQRSVYTMLSGEPTPQENAQNDQFPAGEPLQPYLHPEEYYMPGDHAFIYQMPYYNLPAQHEEIGLDHQDLDLDQQHNVLFSSGYLTEHAEEQGADWISSDGSVISFLPPPEFGDVQIDYPTYTYPMVTSYGTVLMQLRHLARVEIGVGGAIYVDFFPGKSIATISSNMEKCCLIHPNGKMLQDESGINTAFMEHRAKICQRGVLFESSSKALCYLVDESGTKTTAERFQPLTEGDALKVFHDESVVSDSDACFMANSMVYNASFDCSPSGDIVWIIGETQVKQTRWGCISISRGSCSISLLPTVSEFCVQTSNVKATVSCYRSQYFSVQSGTKRINAGYCGTIFQNGTQRAGLDKFGKLVIF